MKTLSFALLALIMAASASAQTPPLESAPETIGFYNQRKWTQLSLGAFENALLAEKP